MLIGCDVIYNYDDINRKVNRFQNIRVYGTISGSPGEKTTPERVLKCYKYDSAGIITW
jgi:hypothetical protein